MPHRIKDTDGKAPPVRQGVQRALQDAFPVEMPASFNMQVAGLLDAIDRAEKKRLDEY